jgi:serine/threonine-protein kinase
MVAMLNNLSSSLFVVPDEDDHSLRFVRFNAGIGKPEQYLLDLRPAFGGIEYEARRGFRARSGREAWPVNQVTWFGASVFCRTQGKRLPTENEWEAAARGRADRPFPWGVDAPRCGEVVVPSDGFLPMDRSCPKTTSPVDVGTALEDVTAAGVHDLGGNVTEWVSAAFVQGDRGRTGPPDDPTLPRVLRGGSFYFSLLARTSVRNRRPADYVGIDVGFRCAADLTID